MAIAGKAHPLTVPRGLSSAEVTQNRLRTRDDLDLYYEVIGDQQFEKTMVLANGLGGRLYSWGPVLRGFKDRYRFVTWDYRGLFESGAPERIRRLSIMDHAEDLAEILERINADSVIVAGWSMGVQVGLEFASVYPDKVDGLILLNGSYGHIFSSGFQPIFRIPYIENLLHGAIELASAQSEIVESIGNWFINYMDTIVEAQIALSPASSNREELKSAMKQYLKDIFGTEFQNYLRLFQELDAHSAYHLLPGIDVPSLIISGGLDVLTPAYESRTLARRLPESRHRHLWLANHFAMLEYPDTVVEEIDRFLSDYSLVSPKANSQ